MRPRHLEFVEKRCRHADIILPWRDYNRPEIEMFSRMRGLLEL